MCTCRYTWWYNGARLDLNEEFIRPLTDGDIEITLESMLAEGTYQCEASNQYGRIFTSSVINCVEKMCQVCLSLYGG